MAESAQKSTLFQKYGQTVEPGRPVFREGEPGDTMYIIQRGRVKITKRIGDVEKILMVLQKGDFFGEMSIIIQAKRSATATAIDQVELLSFNRQGFISMISKNSNIAMNIIEKLCFRLEKADNQIRDLTKRDIKSLVISALNDLRFTSKGENGCTDCSVFRYLDAVRHIAGQIGATEKEVQNELERLSTTGMLSISGNTLELKQAGEIDKLAGFFKG
jgi:CRP-like cAMP-binding protein